MNKVAIFVMCFFSALVHGQDLLIKNINVITGQYPDALADQNVLIQNGRIVSLQSGDKPINVENVEWVIDGQGKFLTPGLFDGHVHVSSIPGMGFGSEPVARRHPQLVDDYYHQQPRSFLYYGVTSVLDPNPGINWTAFSSASPAPRLFRCAVITSKDTFPVVEKSDAESLKMYPYLIQQGVEPSHALSVESQVDRAVTEGARCLKLYFEDGYGDASRWPLLTEATIQRIQTKATEHELPILAHANAIDMYEQAIAAKVNVLAHGLWNWGPYARQTSLTDDMKRLLDQLIDKHIGFMPSQRVIAGLGEQVIQPLPHASAFDDIVPANLLNWYQQPEAQWFTEELRAGFDGLPDEFIARAFLQNRINKNAQVIRYLASQGLPILLGSDFPGSPTYANQPGLTSFLEMKALADAGLPLHQVMLAGTLNNARQFGLDTELGLVAKDFRADLLILNSNPLQSVDAWQDIDTVVVDGFPYARSQLKAKH